MPTADGEHDDPMLGYAEIAALMAERGYRATVKGLRAQRAMGRLPEPDAHPAPDRPRWRRSTILAWLDNRPGQGRRTDLRR